MASGEGTQGWMVVTAQPSAAMCPTGNNLLSPSRAFTRQLPLLGVHQLFPKRLSQGGGDSPGPFCAGSRVDGQEGCEHQGATLSSPQAAAKTLQKNPRTHPKTHIWDHQVTRGGYLDSHGVGQRFMGRRGGLCPLVPRAIAPLGGEEPPTCPKPKRASEHTRGTSRGLQPLWDTPGTNPFTKSSSQRHPQVESSALGRVKPSAPRGISKTRALPSRRNKGVPLTAWGLAAPGQGCAPGHKDTKPASSASPRS